MGFRVCDRKITLVWALLAGGGTALKFARPTGAVLLAVTGFKSGAVLS